MLLRLLQPLNIVLDIQATFLPITMLSKLVQSAKVSSLIVVTLSEISMLVRLMQPPNAL